MLLSKAGSELPRRLAPGLAGAALLVGLVLASRLGAAPAGATPFRPTSESEVLEELPLRLGGAPASAGAAPRDASTAAARARKDIELYQATSDPRYLGHAEAQLGWFWERADAPDGVTVLRAKIRASNHDFEGALGDLERVLSHDSRNAQALFERAAIHTVRGAYAAAGRDCAALSLLVSELDAAGCRAAVLGATGNARRAGFEVRSALSRAANASADESAWAESLLGELAQRAGDAHGAELALRSALQQKPRDAYTLGNLADLLLDVGRPREVASLLAGFERIDGLLLRLAIAERQLGLASVERHIADLAERFEEAHLRGSAVHLREEARFELHLRDHAGRALELALANFRVQRETWDTRLVLESALAAKAPLRAREAADFARESANEDPMLRRLLRALEGAT